VSGVVLTAAASGIDGLVHARGTAGSAAPAAPGAERHGRPARRDARWQHGWGRWEFGSTGHQPHTCRTLLQWFVGGTRKMCRQPAASEGKDSD